MIGVGGVVASLTITVDDHGVQTTPGSAAPLALEIGDTLALSATATNALGLAVSGVSPIWSSSASSIVAVSGTGVAKALAVGSAEVQATVDEVTAFVSVVVSDTTTAPPPGP